jgi:hypothetical protein
MKTGPDIRRGEERKPEKCPDRSTIAAQQELEKSTAADKLFPALCVRAL